VTQFQNGEEKRGAKIDKINININMRTRERRR